MKDSFFRKLGANTLYILSIGMMILLLWLCNKITSLTIWNTFQLIFCAISPLVLLIIGYRINVTLECPRCGRNRAIVTTETRTNNVSNWYTYEDAYSVYRERTVVYRQNYKCKFCDYINYNFVEKSECDCLGRSQAYLRKQERQSRGY